MIPDAPLSQRPIVLRFHNGHTVLAPRSSDAVRGASGPLVVDTAPPQTSEICRCTKPLLLTWKDGRQYCALCYGLYNLVQFVRPQQRNDHCACGSGKKFKDCHGLPVPVPREVAS